MASHSADVLAFDCHSQLEFKGADAYRRHLEACMPCMQGPMLFELHDLNIVAQDDVAFCHYLALCGATGADGTENRCWLRDHVSAPDGRDVENRARPLLRSLRSAERQGHARLGAAARRARERGLIHHWRSAATADRPASSTST
jgi:hypothetical protein